MMMRGMAVTTILTLVIGVVPPTVSAAAGEVSEAVNSCTIVSNASVIENDAPAFVVDRNPAWFDISGASWIWGDADNVVSTTTQTFTKHFIVNGTSTAANLTLAADNGYEVRVNGSIVYIDNSINNFGLTVNHDIKSKLTMNADNVIEIKVKNYDVDGINPAGLAFKIEMTGNTCEPLPPPDLCTNREGNQATVPAGYTAEGGACFPTVVITGNDSPKKCIGENLVQNGSFELPATPTGYSLYETILGWTNTTASGFEIWNNQNGAAADGSQHLELDVVATSAINQSITTVPGNVYQVSVAFSPRSGRNLADNKVGISFGGTEIGTMSADGTPYSENVWSAAVFNATAVGTTSLLELADLGTSNGYGTLVDDVRVCLVKDNTPVEVDTYEVYGFVWDDVDTDDTKEDGEANLEGWTVRAVNASNSEQVITDTTDAAGRYSLNVPAGTWIISQLTENGWTLLSVGTNGDGTYTVTVPVPVVRDGSELSFLDRILPQALAAAFENVAGPFNFGNDEDRRGGSSSGTRTNRSPSGVVLGASTVTPNGVVLGAATTTMPVGAPNTGAGGTAQVTVTLPTILAVLAPKVVVRKIK